MQRRQFRELQCLLPARECRSPQIFRSAPGACTIIWPQQAACVLLKSSPSGQDNWLAAKPCFMEGRTHELPLNPVRTSGLLLLSVLLTKPVSSEEGCNQGRVGWM